MKNTKSKPKTPKTAPLAKEGEPATKTPHDTLVSPNLPQAERVERENDLA
jgi:hypothetical protein